MKQVLQVLMGVLAGFILAGGLLFIMRAPEGQAIILEPAPTDSPIAVHIVGAVPRPGLYEFPEGARVQDAIDAAGGLLATADVEGINLAALLEDGQQLDIPFTEGAEVPATSEPELPGSTPPPNAEDLVNINTASLEELDALPGIGPTTAQKIIDYRDANGPFAQIEDIMNVSGIGPSTFENIKDLITV
ncbi:MAG: ComEA family DNA-binding protein [Chloroflexi bacterium]|nr:ComEA family DNA-binding protein [Chloroflexota bacterium]